MSRPYRPRLKPAVAYIRVSTEKQGESGVGLAAQSAAIELYAKSMGFHILQTFEDVASAIGETSIALRPGLQNAVGKALADNATILVHDISRIGRHSATVTKLIRNSRVRILEVSTGGKMEGILMQVAAVHAETVGRAISTNTKKALAEKKRQGVILGNTKNLAEAQALGAKASSAKADRVVSDIADVLGADAGYANLSAAKIVELLKSAGLLSGRGLPWTVSGIRRPLANAKKLIEERDLQRMKDENPTFGMF